MFKSLIIILLITSAICNGDSTNEEKLNKNSDEVSEIVQETKTAPNSDEEYLSDITTDDDNMRSASELKEVNNDNDFDEVRSAEETQNEEPLDINGKSDSAKSEKRSVDTQIEKSTVESSDDGSRTSSEDKEDDEINVFKSRGFDKLSAMRIKALDGRSSTVEEYAEIDEKSDDLNEEMERTEYESDSSLADLDDIPLRRKSKPSHVNRIIEMKAREDEINNQEEAETRTLPESKIGIPVIRNNIGNNRVNRLPNNFFPNARPSEIQNQFLYNPTLIPPPLMPVNLNYGPRNNVNDIRNNPFVPIMTRRNDPNPKIAQKSVDHEESKKIDDFDSQPFSNAYPYSPKTAQENYERSAPILQIKSPETLSSSIIEKLGLATGEPQNIGLKREQNTEAGSYMYNNVNPLVGIPTNINALRRNVQLWQRYQG